MEAAEEDVPEVHLWEAVAVGTAPGAPAVLDGVAVQLPAVCSCGKNRPVGKRIGYTWYHLEISSFRPPASRNAEAALAIRAAPMARSSFPILSRLK